MPHCLPHNSVTSAMWRLVGLGKAPFPGMHPAAAGAVASAYPILAGVWSAAFRRHAQHKGRHHGKGVGSWVAVRDCAADAGLNAWLT